MNEEAMILKRDAGGRVVVPEERRVELVREYERSGLSGAMAAAQYPSLTPAVWTAARQPAKPASKAPAAASASTQQRRCA